MAHESVKLSARQTSLNALFVALYSVIYGVPLRMTRWFLSMTGAPRALNGGWTNERLWRGVVRLLIRSKRFAPRTMSPAPAPADIQQKASS
jgi:hypothetical protein